MSGVRVKVCGVTSVEDALACVEAGVDALGLNFVPSSPRLVDEDTARAIVDVVRGRALVVGVFADEAEAEVARVRDEVGLGCVQLHGGEPPELVARFLPHAYKALRVRGPEVDADAARYPGRYLLVDAHVAGALGGTGTTFAWPLVARLASERRLTLAGGLTPENVADAVRAVRPYCVDVASGVEAAPGVKDAVRVRAFVRAARSA